MPNLIPSFLFRIIFLCLPFPLFTAASKFPVFTWCTKHLSPLQQKNTSSAQKAWCHVLINYSWVYSLKTNYLIASIDSSLFFFCCWLIDFFFWYFHLPLHCFSDFISHSLIYPNTSYVASFYFHFTDIHISGHRHQFSLSFQWYFTDIHIRLIQFLFSFNIYISLTFTFQFTDISLTFTFHFIETSLDFHFHDISLTYEFP